MSSQTNGTLEPETPPPGPVTAALPGYTPAQVAHYLKHISFPLPLSHPRDATFLKILHRCQITSIPYENLSLHYNPAHSTSIDPQAIYAKFLPDFADPNTSQSRGRGGYCFEDNIFFLFCLRALGFTAYPTSARIRLRDHHTRVPAGPFVGPCHLVIIIVLQDGTTWSSDVGFGGDGPIWPLQLTSAHTTNPDTHEAEEEEAVAGAGAAVANLGTQQIRVRKGTFPGTVRPETSQAWFYEYRNAVTAPWNTYYAFSEAEASLWDLEYCNWWVSTSPKSFQTVQVLGVKFIRDHRDECPPLPQELEEGNGEKAVYRETGIIDPASLVRITGKIMLADASVKKNMGGKTELVTVCKTEEERVQVLQKYFGIILNEEAQEGIRGHVSELKG